MCQSGVFVSGMSGAEDLSTQQVAEYLRQHPHFFAGQDDLLSRMVLPHKADGTLSLAERQLSVLRQQNEAFEQELADLVA